MSNSRRIEARRKIWKTLYSDITAAQICVEDSAAFLSAGERGKSLIECTTEGVYLQGDRIAINNWYINRPMFKNQNPMVGALTASIYSVPQYTFDLPVLEVGKQVAGIMSMFTALSTGIK